MSKELFAGLSKPAVATEAAVEAEAQNEAANPQVDETRAGAEEEDVDPTAPAMPSELDMLKNQARIMKIPFSNNIGLEALKAKVKAALEGQKEAEKDPEPEAQATAPAAPSPVSKTAPKETLRQRIIREQMALVRVRITNMDPKKKDLPGEIFTVANDYLGTVKKYIPYGEATENGYHVPLCIFNELQDRTFLNIRTRKDQRTGQIHVESKYVREFALEVLPQLTERELAQLAAAQAAAGGLD